MKEAGMKYTPNAQITMKPSIFAKARGYFNMFGLGVKTGIDLPVKQAVIQDLLTKSISVQHLTCHMVTMMVIL